MLQFLRTLGPILLLLWAVCHGQGAAAKTAEIKIGPIVQGSVVDTIRWTDGEQGRLYLQSGAIVRFRLVGIDAPETVSPDAVGPRAGCTAEQALGLRAKAFFEQRSVGQKVIVSYVGRWIRYDTALVSLSVGGYDLAKAGLDAGHLRISEADRDLTNSFGSAWCDSSENKISIIAMN